MIPAINVIRIKFERKRQLMKKQTNKKKHYLEMVFHIKKNKNIRT